MRPQNMQLNRWVPGNASREDQALATSYDQDKKKVSAISTCSLSLISRNSATILAVLCRVGAQEARFEAIRLCCEE